jgi:hypothetical protein
MKNQLTDLVRVRLTKKDRELMEQYAAKLRMSLSDYIRFSCLTKPPKEVYEDEPRRS